VPDRRLEGEMVLERVYLASIVICFIVIAVLAASPALR
jgi:hypothetical protein